jgi:putative ABC transport system permease protein
MYRNYFKIALRNLMKNKAFSLINITGLSLGLMCSMLTALWVYNEYNIDCFHADAHRLYAVTSAQYSGDQVNGSYGTPALLADELKKVLPEVEYASGYAWPVDHAFSSGENKTKQSGNYVGTDFFKIFSYPLLSGSAETALVNAQSIAISKKMATILFDSPELALGQTIRYENERDLTVTAVFDDPGDLSSEKFHYLLHWDLFLEENEWIKDWHNTGPGVFIKVREGSSESDIRSKLQHFVKKYDSQYTEADRVELGIQPYTEKYLYSNFDNGKIAGGRIAYVRVFEAVAIFILVIACINFMNLSTARSVNRAKEIAVRKVVGAFKGSLIKQFYIEAFVLTAISVLLALALLSLALPSFAMITAKPIHLPAGNATFWIGIVMLTLVTAFASGSYPALMLSSFKPASILKNNTRVKSSGVFRKALVVFQFALTMIFMVAMIVTSQQLDFIQNKDVGYQKTNLIYVPITGALSERYNAFKEEGLKLPGVKNISSISQKPVEIANTTGGVKWEGKAPDSDTKFTQAAVGYDFIETMQATLAQGRDFSEDFADSASYIINETALKTIGYKNPLGMPLSLWGINGQIIGVVKDFHFNSLYEPIIPLVLRLKTTKPSGEVLIRAEAGKTGAVLGGMKNLHDKLNPQFMFDYQFADQEYNTRYASENVIKDMAKFVAAFAVFISCMGLLGLVTFSAQQRTKELGIRKVLGASIGQIVGVLSKDFIVLILLGSVIASPFAYYFTSEWLNGFEYHISIRWWFFVLAAASALIIALVTIGIQAVKAALENPVRSLRAE